jgi:hypothetical protein
MQARLGGAEQLPIPCSKCGAPMRDLPQYFGYVGCGYCGTTEELPPDAAGRVRRLRGRLLALAQAERDVHEADLSVARRIESFNRTWIAGTLKAAAGPLTIIIVVIAANLAFPIGPWSDPMVLPLFTRLVVPFTTTLACIFLGYLVVSRRYRRKLRPRLLARAPLQLGSPTRCRRCGGNLPDAREAFVRCLFCRATNLVTPEIASERERLLSAEIEYYIARAAGVRDAPLDHARLVSAGVVIGQLIGMVGGVGLGFLLEHWYGVK